MKAATFSGNALESQTAWDFEPGLLPLRHAKKSDCAFRDSEAAAFRSPMQADAPFSWVAVSSSNVACVEKHKKFEKQFDM